MVFIFPQFSEGVGSWNPHTYLTTLPEISWCVDDLFAVHVTYPRHRWLDMSSRTLEQLDMAWITIVLEQQTRNDGLFRICFLKVMRES